MVHFKGKENIKNVILKWRDVIMGRFIQLLQKDPSKAPSKSRGRASDERHLEVWVCYFNCGVIRCYRTIRHEIIRRTINTSGLLLLITTGISPPVSRPQTLAQSQQEEEPISRVLVKRTFLRRKINKYKKIIK